MKFRAKPHLQTGSRILDESFLRCAPPHVHVAWVDHHLPGKGFGTRALDHSWQGKPDDKPEIGLGWVYDVIIQLLGCPRLTQSIPVPKGTAQRFFLKVTIIFVLSRARGKECSRHHTPNPHLKYFALKTGATLDQICSSFGTTRCIITTRPIEIQPLPLVHHPSTLKLHLPPPTSPNNG